MSNEHEELEYVNMTSGGVGFMFGFSGEELKDFRIFRANFNEVIDNSHVKNVHVRQVGDLLNVPVFVNEDGTSTFSYGKIKITTTEQDANGSYTSITEHSNGTTIKNVVDCVVGVSELYKDDVLIETDNIVSAPTKYSYKLMADLFKD